MQAQTEQVRPAPQTASATKSQQTPVATTQPVAKPAQKASGNENEKINWVTIEEALALQKKEPRKIMIDVYTKWCGPCKMMASTTFMNDDVANYVNKNFYAVKFDAESPEQVNYLGNVYRNPTYDPSKAGRNGVHELSLAFYVQAYPTIVILGEDGKYLNQSRGMLNAQQLECLLRYFRENHHQSVAWTDWQAKCQPTFK